MEEDNQGNEYAETPLEVRNSAKKSRKKIAKKHDPKKQYSKYDMEETQSEAGFYGEMELMIRKNKWKKMQFAISNKEGVLFWWARADKGPKGFRFLWDAKTQNDKKPEHEGRVFKLLPQAGSDLTFRCSSVAEVAKWKTEIMKNSELSMVTLHADAVEFWKYVEEKKGEKGIPFIHGKEFDELFPKWIVEEKKLKAPTKKNMEVMRRFIASIPIMMGVAIHDAVTFDQLKSYCTSFGYLTQAYCEYDVVTEWYRGVLTAEEMNKMWDTPVHAYHFIIRLEASSNTSSTMIITYTDKLLHVLHAPVIVHPYTSRFMLLGSGEVYETVQDLVESHSRLTFAISDNIDDIRAAHKKEQEELKKH